LSKKLTLLFIWNSVNFLLSECVWFNVPLDTEGLGHFRDESFQAIDCSGNDNLTTKENIQNTK